MALTEESFKKVKICVKCGQFFELKLDEDTDKCDKCRK